MAPPPSPRGRQVTVVQALALLLAFVLAAGVGGLLTAGLVMPTVAAANTATDLSVQAFEDLPGELEPGPLSENSTMLAADGTVLATFFAENRVVVSLDQVSKPMQDAVVATEDRRFYLHGGIDPAGMMRALVQNQLGSSQQGASTLTQQYVKNVLIEAATREGDVAAVEEAREDQGPEGYARKLREAKLAIALEKRMTKDEILENYLNIAQFGVATYGVESAAQRYFSKSAAEVTYLEAATIAGITNSPTLYDPVKNPESSEKRRNTVLNRMLRENYITQEEYDLGVATPIADTLHVSEPRSGCMAAGDVVAGSGFFCDYVTRVIENDPAFGETAEERRDVLLRGGLTIRTTLDPRQQSIADAEVKAGVPVDDPQGIGSAISVVEPGTGQIKAMAENRNFNNSADATGRDTSVNYNTSYDYGGSTGFAPGSTFKPFTLLEWLKQGHNLSERVNGSVRPLNENQFTSCGAKGINKSWTPGNAEGGRGIMSVADATKGSVNLAYLTMAMQLDLCNVMDGAAQLGVVKAGGKSGTGRGVRDVRLRRHVLPADRDHQRPGRVRGRAADPVGELHAGDQPGARERDELRDEQGVGGHGPRDRPAVRLHRVREDRHDLGERVHLVRRLHPAPRDGGVGRLPGQVHADAGRPRQRPLHPQHVRRDDRRSDVEAVHGPGARRRAAEPGVRRAVQRLGVRQARGRAVGRGPGRGHRPADAGGGRVHGHRGDPGELRHGPGGRRGDPGPLGHRDGRVGDHDRAVDGAGGAAEHR
jgi:membrane peptidoglycan carboxypeptidase